MKHRRVGLKRAFTWVVIGIELAAIGWFSLRLGALLVLPRIGAYAQPPPMEPAALKRMSVELQQKQAQWESQRITHYRMKLDLQGYGYGQLYQRMPLAVEVKDGQVISVIDARGQIMSPDTEYPYVFDRVYPNLFTIPGLFSFLNETFTERPAALSVMYDPQFGYPTDIELTRYWEPCCQEVSYLVTELERLP